MESGHCDDCVFAKRHHRQWFCSLRDEEVSQEWVCGCFLSEYDAPQWQSRFQHPSQSKQGWLPGDKAAVATIVLGLAMGIGFCVWGCLP